MIHKNMGVYLLDEDSDPDNEVLLFDDNGDIYFSVHISEDDITNIDLANDIVAIANDFCSDDGLDGDYAYIDIAFTIPSILDTYIEYYRHRKNVEKGKIVINSRNRELFDKLKDELQGMIGKIDSIEFVDDNTDD